MTRAIVVNLSSNGAYWQADYKDAAGKRRKRSIGPKAEMSRRHAKKECQKLENELNKKPSLAAPGKVPKLGEFVDAYVNSRTDLKPGTLYLHRLTKKYLTAFFGEQVRLNEVTRALARGWQTALARGDFSGGHAMATPTVRGHLVNAKAIFRRAVDDDLILLNPFDRISVQVPKIDKNWHYVTTEELDKLLNACKTPGWKTLIALCRLAGLRRGEALKLPWSAVDWLNRRLTVYAEKTERHGGNKRIVPIEPKLYDILFETLNSAGDGEEFVCKVSPHCLWRNFTVIRKRAGLLAWDDAFQVMRRNAETDWAQRFPQYAVSEWLGHDIKVSATHYLAVPEELYQKVAGQADKPAVSVTAMPAQQPSQPTLPECKPSSRS
jgi:integrase